MSIETAVKAIDEYYQSANEVPVTVARIPVELWSALKSEIEKQHTASRASLLDYYMKRSGQRAHMTLANWFCAATGHKDAVLQNIVNARTAIDYILSNHLTFDSLQLQSYNVSESRNPNFSRS
jgi:hypothetical protein